MALAYARIEAVKRSEGQCMFGLAMYIAKMEGYFEGSVTHKAKKYDYTKGADELIYHGIFLPKGVDKKFLDLVYLWNKVAEKEKRKDSQEGYHLLFALPVESSISDKERKEIVKKFISEHLEKI